MKLLTYSKLLLMCHVYNEYMINTKFNHIQSNTADCGVTGLIKENNMCNYESIKQAFDYHHGDTSGQDTGYCVEYHVTFNAPSWSTGQWFNVEGLTKDGSLVSLLSIGYSYQYPWLVAGTYRI